MWPIILLSGANVGLVLQTEGLLMQSIIQILKLNEPRAWAMDGRSGMSHSAECMLLTDDGSVDQVGVLRIRGDELIAKARVGIFRGSFAMRANPQSRQIEAVLTDLSPIRNSGTGFVADTSAKP